MRIDWELRLFLLFFMKLPMNAVEVVSMEYGGTVTEQRARKCLFLGTALNHSPTGDRSIYELSGRLGKPNFETLR